MQTISMQNSVSVQVQPSRSVASVQTRTSHISCAVQADPSPPPSYASSDVQTDPILPVLDLTGIHPTMNDEHTLQYTPARESHAMLTPPLSVEIPEPREPSEDMDMSPIGFEERERPIPGLTPSIRSLPHPRPEVKAENIFLPGLTQQPSSASPLRSLSRAKAEEIEHIRQQPSPVSDMFDLDDDPPDPPLRIPEPAPQNSFVSGGFVTDLIGAVTSPTKEGTSAGEEEGEILETDSAHPLNSPASHPPLLSPAQRKKKRQSVAANERRRKKRVRLAQAKLLAAGNPPLNDSDVATTSNVATPIDGVLEAQDEVTPAPSPPPPLIPAPPRPRGPTQNAVASSSKVVSTAPPPPPPLLHPGTNILPGVLNRMKQKAPANANQAIDLTSSPPPEPKAIARIPVGPSSNPLSIRPSNPPLQSTRPRPPPSTSTSTAVAATSKAKKKIVVGRGWPFVRAVGTSSSAAAALAPARSQPVASSSKVDLSSIMKYQSPSPPPVNKWKRIDDEISISVPPTDDDEAIRSLSPVPHPRPQVKAGDVSLPGIVHQPSSAPVNKWKRIDDRLRTPKPAPKNSFVSGGFVTDFIGAATLPTKEDPPIVQEEGPRLETDSPLNSPASDRSLLSPAQRKQKTQNEKRVSFARCPARVNKWVQIDDDISIGVPPTDVDEAMDMVISEPPSPVSEPPPLPPPSSTDTSSSTSLADRISSPVPISLPVDIPLSAQPSSENVRSDSLLSRIFPPEIRPPTLPPSTPGQKVTGPAAHTASQNDSDSSGTKSNFEAPTPTAAFSVYHAPIPTAAFGVPSPQDHKQKRPALPPQIVTFAAANVSNNATATATKRAPPQLSVSQKNKGSVTMLPIHHSLPPKPPPPVALPRGTKRERPPSPDPRTASSIGIARVQDRRWPTIKVMHTDTLEGDGDLGIRQIAFNSDGSCFALYCASSYPSRSRSRSPSWEYFILFHLRSYLRD
ncbi:hypothetical protein B0H16DRAFT_187461 [Mycena metata]|uniref:Uncharacterized protein n=1 Tax=Mycena metata TaxID=1033252 RepID=A0AAD7JTG1_9AGAR|nr:hypothetical protein B0H16DRAFT_187461 [Mycena metata]